MPPSWWPPSSTMKDDLVAGILHAQEMIKGSITILLMTPDGILAARDRLGRLPVLVGKHPDGGLLRILRVLRLS